MRNSINLIEFHYFPYFGIFTHKLFSILFSFKISNKQVRFLKKNSNIEAFGRIPQAIEVIWTKWSIENYRKSLYFTDVFNVLQILVFYMMFFFIDSQRICLKFRTNWTRSFLFFFFLKVKLVFSFFCRLKVCLFLKPDTLRLNSLILRKFYWARFYKGIQLMIT